MLHFGKIPNKIGEHLLVAEFSKILTKFGKKSAKISAIFNEKVEIRERDSMAEMLSLKNGAKECIV